MKFSEINELSSQDLNKQLEEAYEELFNLRLKLATKRLVNHREPERVKKNIARLKTAIRQKELGIR